MVTYITPTFGRGQAAMGVVSPRFPPMGDALHRKCDVMLTLQFGPRNAK